MTADAVTGSVLLRLEDVGARTDGGWVLRDVTLGVAPAEAVGLVGPRGSGKTALLDTVSGFLHPAQGRVSLAGYDITGWRPHHVARAGIARSFQTADSPEDTTVLEAVAESAIGRGLSARATRDAVRRALLLTGLDGAASEDAAALPAAERRLLALARVAAAAPRLALLDEPLAGLAPPAAGLIVSALRRLHEAGVALLVTAHNPASLRVLCSRAVVLRDGRITGGGRPTEIRCA
jgi:ABC-type branched-subunit amino acid transport system ATPase component